MKTWCLYIHYNINNGKSYIGITSQNPLHRWRNNGNGYINNREFYNAIKKYGWETGFLHAVLYENLTEKQAKKLEIQLIKEYDSFENGYNQTVGGEGTNGYIFSDEQKEQIRVRMIGNTRRKGTKTSKIARDNMSKSHIGKPSPRKGCKLSCEQVERIRKLHTGRIQSEEEKLKRRNALTGLKRSEDTKRKLSERQLGSNNHKAKKVICLNTMEIFGSCADASRKYNLQINGVSKCCSEKNRKSCGTHPVTGEKLKWVYYEEYLKNIKE